MSTSEAALPNGNILQGIWRVAAPKLTLASVASMIVGIAAAAHDGPLAWGWVLLTVAGIFLIEAAKNASGEVVDWDSGVDLAVTAADRSPFSGGKRVMVDGVLSRGETVWMAAAFYALGAAAGFAIVGLREPSVLWLCLIGVALAYFYHAPPLSLVYRGLGEIAVALSYGPLIAMGTYLVQRGHPWSATLLPSLPVGLLVGAFLWINEFPDWAADRQAGKRNWVVRLGKPRAADAFLAIVIAAFALLIALPLCGAPIGVLGGLIGLPHAIAAARRLRAEHDVTQRIIPAQAWTLLSFLLCAAGAGAGLLLLR
jgi:1,4-dihydroxy-2-naphthoate polyprenyltransferase